MYSRQTRARPGLVSRTARSPVGLQVGDPAAQGVGVVLADGLHVADLEAGPFQLGDGGADRGEFAVREDVGVDERVDLVRRLVALRAAGDLVVEQPSAGDQQGVQLAGVLQVPFGADVFGHADGGDGVEGAVHDVPVVLDPDLHPVGQPLVGDALAGVRRLLLGERDTDDAHAVLAGGVDGHGAPAAAHVQQPLTLFQSQLGADEFELVALGGLQGSGVLPVGAGVHHGRAEDDLVEVVADVVVVADGPPVGAAGVQIPAGSADLLARRGGRDRRAGQFQQLAGGGPDTGVAQGLAEAAGVLAALPDEARHHVEHGVQVALDLQITGDPGAGQAQLARFEQHAAQGAAVAHDERRRVRRPVLRSVPGPQAHRERGPQQLLGKTPQPLRVRRP